MRIDCHMHTPLCGHAVGLPVEYVEAAAARGLGLITFTCHIPHTRTDLLRGEGIRMSHAELPEYFRLVEEARERGQALGVEVLAGIEAEIYPDEAAMREVDDTLAAHPFDFVLGSLHHHISGYRQWLDDHGVEGDRAIIDRYFAHLAEGARSGRYHSLSHPDVIRIYGTVSHFEPADHEGPIRAFLTAVKEAGACMEVNTSGLIKGVYEVHPDPLILDWAAEMKVPLTLGSDAHRPEQVGQHFDEVLDMLRAKGFSHLHYYRGGERHAEPLDDMIAVSTS